MERRGQRGMEQGGQNRNIPINSDARAPLDQGTRTNNLVLIVSLSLVLIAAILFAAKFKKSY